MKKALILIDIQNDYFDCGAYPLYNSNEVLKNSLELVKKEFQKGTLIIFVKHIGEKKSLFFRPNSKGVKIHQKLMDLDIDYKIVEKKYADSFYNTNLDEILIKNDIKEIYLGGMMSHNCVTFTALSKTAEKYKIKVIKKLLTSIDNVINTIAIRALETRVEVI